MMIAIASAMLNNTGNAQARVPLISAQANPATSPARSPLRLVGESALRDWLGHQRALVSTVASTWANGTGDCE
jgi:hypothetical protein